MKQSKILVAFSVFTSRAILPLLIVAALSSCSQNGVNPVKPQKAESRSEIGKRVVSSKYAAFKKSSARSGRQGVAEKVSNILGVTLPQVTSFSQSARFLSPSDESLDPKPAPMPSFPTVDDQALNELHAQASTAQAPVIEDERSLRLLSEAEKFSDYSDRALQEVARASLNRPESSSSQTSFARKVPHGILAVVAFCIVVLIICGFFVISYLLEDLRIRSAPRFIKN